MFRTLALSLVTTAAMLAAATATGAAPADGVWVDGTAATLITGPPSANTSHPHTLFVIAPVNAAHPLHPLASARTHGFGAHDHVIALAHGARSFSGVCDIHLVVPGPTAKPGVSVAMRATLTPAGTKPLLYAARLGGKMLPLDWAARIEQAQRLGLATIVDTKTLLSCFVKR